MVLLGVTENYLTGIQSNDKKKNSDNDKQSKDGLLFFPIFKI